MDQCLLQTLAFIARLRHQRSRTARHMKTIIAVGAVVPALVAVVLDIARLLDAH